MTLSDFLRACLLIGALALCVSCRQQKTATASDIALDLSPADMRVGATAMTARVTDKDGKPVSQPGKLTLRGDMDHAGMRPAIAESDASENGVFIVPFAWTMGGSWQVEAMLELPNGEIVRRTFAYDIMSDHSADMRMDMDSASGVSSAAYMQITNHSPNDIALVAAASDAADSISFHHTQIVDDMAQMKRVDKLVAPANSETELAPGAMHLMLHGLTQDLRPGESVEIQFVGDAGEIYRLDFVASPHALTSADDATRIHDLTFQGRWARPASGG